MKVKILINEQCSEMYLKVKVSTFYMLNSY